ncbi:MAG: hypothetical protein IH786_01945 [Proteobacteria bacterium]|nr:hypothetical protein [Pseudomonadota bacterium]
METQRLADLIAQLEVSVYVVFAQLMVDTSIPLLERLIIYARVPPELQLEVYDDIYPHVLQQFELSELSLTKLKIDVVLTPPPGLEEHRQRKLEAQQAEEKRRRAGEIERR